ncbi:MAG: GntR family transcriptional regulator [Planctomycetes bacterium]|nr:GntR family transcriptional regulator [Planctomycetota bacterium]
MPNYKYLNLSEQLKCEILAANSTSGQKIPTEAELMERFSVSRNTIRQAINLLVGEGFLVKVQGSGTFISERLAEYRGKKRNSQKTKCIGVVMNQVSAYVFPHVLMGISDYLFEHDYYMIIRMTFNQVAREEQVLSEMLEADVAGLIIEPARSTLPTVNRELYKRLEKKYPCVLIHADLPEFSFSSVDNSNVEGYELLLDYLVERGHRDIAALCKLDEQTGVKRYLGYAQGLRKHGLKLNESRVLWFADEDFDNIFSEENFVRIFKTIKNCSAVMCFNDDLANKFLPFLEKHKIRVPEDLSVVGFDDLRQSPDDKPITTVPHAKKELGRTAAKAILRLIENPFADVTHRFTPEIIERETVAVRK